MAATAYASLVSLMNVLNRIEHPSCPAFFNHSHIKSLLDKVTGLINFLEEDYKQRNSKLTEHFARPIADTALTTEDLIESYVVQQIEGHGQEKAYSVIRDGIQKSICEMGFIFEAAMEKVEELRCEEEDDDNELRKFSQTVDSSTTRSQRKTNMVGFDEYLVRLMDQLTSTQHDRIDIPIVGMGGIGKTTLALHTYDRIGSCFDVRAWVTVSQDYSLRKVFLCLLRDVLGEEIVDKMSQMDCESLGEQLHKGLYNRKYLIVLDDIWSSEVWDEIMRFIPDNCNRCRIVFTTRLLEVARDISPDCNPYLIEILDDDMSWNLLYEKVFGQDQEECPPELVECGKKISKSCNGLPLAIVVISGLLVSDKTKKSWETIAVNLESNMKVDEGGLKILSLSYNYLPIHLKPCFLYMATFRKGLSINIAELALLWIAEGFLKPSDEKTLEEIALECVNDLINRNLVMVGKRGSSGKVNWCNVHDVLKDLCIREAEKEGFVCILKEAALLNHPQQKESDCHLVTHRAFVKMSPSLFSYEKPNLHVLYSYFETLLASIPMLPNARLFIATKYGLDANSSSVPSTISLLWNLDTLIVNEIDSDKVSLPCEIWKLAHLRNLVFARMVILPDPMDDGQTDHYVLKNLQTLSTILNFNGTDKVFKRIPNLKRLGIYYDMLEASQSVKVSRCFNNLKHYLHKLETFKCTFARGHRINRGCPFNELDTLTFPLNLKKLFLSGSMIPWENMSIVGSLPNLEVLKLRDDAFCGQEWVPNEDEFQQLKYLSIDGCLLVTWTIESSDHFPILQSLNLRHLRLEFIPEVIGEIDSLKSIELEYCELSAIFAASEVLNERQANGSYDLLIQVTIRPWDVFPEVLELVNDKFRVQSVPTRGKLRFKEMVRSRINEWRELVDLCADAPIFLLRFLAGVFLKTEEFQKILSYYSNIYGQAVLDKIFIQNETGDNVRGQSDFASIDRQAMMQMVDYSILTTSDVSHNLRQEIHDSLALHLPKFFLQLLSSGHIGPSYETTPNRSGIPNPSDKYREIYTSFMLQLVGTLGELSSGAPANPSTSQGSIPVINREIFESFLSQLSGFLLELLPGGRIDPSHKPTEKNVSNETNPSQNSTTVLSREIYESFMSQLPGFLLDILLRGHIHPSHEPTENVSELDPSLQSTADISREDAAVRFANSSIDEVFTVDSIISRYTEQLGLVSIDNMMFLRNNFFSHYMRGVKDEIKPLVEKKIRSGFAENH